MPAFTDEQLDRIGRAGELEIAPRRTDGSMRAFTTVWVVRVDDDLYVRSWNGSDGNWYRGAKHSGIGRARVGGEELDVRFGSAGHDRATIDAAYRDKYGSSRYVDAMVADGAAATTLRLTPR